MIFTILVNLVASQGPSLAIPRLIGHPLVYSHWDQQLTDTASGVSISIPNMGFARAVWVDTNRVSITSGYSCYLIATKPRLKLIEQFTSTDSALFTFAARGKKGSIKKVGVGYRHSFGGQTKEFPSAWRPIGSTSNGRFVLISFQDDARLGLADVSTVTPTMLWSIDSSYQDSLHGVFELLGDRHFLVSEADIRTDAPLSVLSLQAKTLKGTGFTVDVMDLQPIVTGSDVSVVAYRGIGLSRSRWLLVFRGAYVRVFSVPDDAVFAYWDQRAKCAIIKKAGNLRERDMKLPESRGKYVSLKDFAK